ncbi:MAG: hypothetical protein LBI37_02215 [Puniceicoccales bacterium]|nr:hypothetical protein [Puniceicoccales bacterium]
MRCFSSERVTFVLCFLKTRDRVIQKYATNCQINRFAKIELSLLPMTVAEMLFTPDIPPVLTINRPSNYQDVGW